MNNISSFLLKRYLSFSGAPRWLKVSALITCAGISLAVAVLVVTLSIAGGFESAYKRSILDFNAHIVFLKDGEMDDYEGVIKYLDGIEGIAVASPFIYRESMAVAKGVVKGVVIKGVDFARLPSISNMAIKYFGVDVPMRSSANAVLLGNALASKLNITAPTAINIMIAAGRFQKVEITGTFESGLYDYDSQFILMPLEKVQKMFGAPNKVTGIEMKAEDLNDAPLLASMIGEVFDYPYQVTHWEELNRPIFEAIHLEKIMFAVIIGVLVLVGMFNIIGTIVLRILYKAKDIAILTSLGAGSFFIRGLFTFQGLMLGVVGTCTGIAMGLLAVYAIGRLELVKIEPEIYFLKTLPVRVEWGWVIAVAVVGWLVSFIVSLAASAKIAAVDVADGLKQS